MSLSITIPDTSNISEQDRQVLMIVLGIEQPKPDELIAARYAGDPVVPPLILQGEGNGLPLPRVLSSHDLPPTPAPAPAPASGESAHNPGVEVGGAPASIELDKNGLPWDARIHSKTRAKNQDGSWRSKREVDPALVVSVEAELRAVMSAPVAEPVAPPAPAAIIPPAPPAPSPEVLPVTPVVTADSPFAAFMTRITPHIAAKTLGQADIAAVVQKHSLPHLGALANRPDLIPQVEADLNVIIGGAK